MSTRTDYVRKICQPKCKAARSGSFHRSHLPFITMWDDLPSNVRTTMSTTKLHECISGYIPNINSPLKSSTGLGDHGKMYKRFPHHIKISLEQIQVGIMATSTGCKPPSDIATLLLMQRIIWVLPHRSVWVCACVCVCVFQRKRMFFICLFFGFLLPFFN